MKPEIAELEAQVILRNSNRLAKAKAVLEGRSEPSAWVFGAGYGFSTAMALYLMAGTAVSDLVRAVVIGVLSVLVSTVIETWSLRRRLEAAIELLKLRESKI